MQDCTQWGGGGTEGCVPGGGTYLGDGTSVGAVKCVDEHKKQVI